MIANEQPALACASTGESRLRGGYTEHFIIAVPPGRSWRASAALQRGTASLPRRDLNGTGCGCCPGGLGWCCAGRRSHRCLSWNGACCPWGRDCGSSCACGWKTWTGSESACCAGMSAAECGCDCGCGYGCGCASTGSRGVPCCRPRGSPWPSDQCGGSDSTRQSCSLWLRGAGRKGPGPTPPPRSGRVSRGHSHT